MNQLDELKLHYQSLSQRDQKLAIATSVILLITLFYIAVWEPLHHGFEKQKRNHITQIEIYSWMKNAAVEVKTLKRSGNTQGKILKHNSPVTIVAELSAKISGLKKYISKIESSGKNSAQIRIENASFNQMLLWMNSLKTRYGIDVASAKIERTDKEGIINARLTLNRIE